MQDFHLLMDELGILLDTTLIPDKHNACVLNFDDELKVQLEPDAPGHTLILGSEIGEIPAGKFRENILATGLKFNAHCPRIGTFAYLAKANLLIYFYTLELEGLQALTITEILPIFVATGKLWKESVSKGMTPVLNLTEGTTKPSIFDITT